MSCTDIIPRILAVRRIIIVVLTPIVLLPLAIVGGSSESKCAYVVIIMAVYWISEALPIAVTALLPIILFPLVGLMSAKTVSSVYVNDTSTLFIGGLIVAAAIEQWNIHRRIALKILSIVGSEPRWLMLGLMLPTWFLSMWISNTATTAMMVPIANAILIQLKDITKSTEENEKGIDNEALDVDEIRLKSIKHKDVYESEDSVSLPLPNGKHNEEKEESVKIENIITSLVASATFQPFSTRPRDSIKRNKDDQAPTDEKQDPHYARMTKALSLCIAYAANVGGIGSLTGTGPNVVMKGQADIVYENKGGKSPVTFATWMQFGLPLSAVLLVVLWGWLQVFFLRCKGCCSCCDDEKQNDEVNRRVKSVIRAEYKKLGPVTFAQGVVMCHFVLLAVLWISRDLGGVGGWGDIFPENTVTDSTPSILIASSMFVFPSAIPTWIFRRYEEKKKVVPLLSWDVIEKKVPWGVVFLIGGGFAMARASEDSGLSAWLGDKLTVFGSLEPWVINLVLCYIVAAATEVTSNTATCTLMMPIMAQLAFKLNVNPLYFMFPTAIATSFAYMLPVATPPNAVVFSYGYIKVIDMVSAGFFMNIVAVPILVLATETYGNSIFGFHTLPEIFRKTASNGSMVPLYNESCWCTNSTVNSTISDFINNILN